MGTKKSMFLSERVFIGTLQDASETEGAYFRSRGVLNTMHLQRGTTRRRLSADVAQIGS